MKYGLYCNVNKNDDELFVSVFKLGIQKAETAEKRALNIITSDYVPAMMPGAKSTYFVCKMCPMHAICHNGEKIEKNCRSCAYAVPTNNAEWRCSRVGQDIPRDFVPIGCDDYKAIV